MESFWDRLPDDPTALVRGWLIEPPGGAATASRELRKVAASFEWIAAPPDHFLHVWVGPARDVDAESARRSWSRVEPFAIDYRRANCFHEAVIVEAHAGGVRRLVELGLPHVDRTVLLPHMSVGYTRRSERPAELRAALAPFRDAEFGRGLVREVLLCDVPVSRSTILQPWTVLDRVTLG